VKIVFDTNVLFAALARPDGFCAQVVELSVSRHVIVSSDHIIDELRRHLAGKRRLSPRQVQAVVAAVLGMAAQIVVPSSVASAACRDPNDLPVLGTAIAGAADVLVTGDQDLLILQRFEGVLILSPRHFHDRFLKPAEDPGI
jgi:putative PIN family toxin of toxin-antitoxin system